MGGLNVVFRLARIDVDVFGFGVIGVRILGGGLLNNGG